MPVMKSLRAFRLATLSGHVIQVPANTPVHIPDGVMSQALAEGMVPTDEPIATEAVVPTAPPPAEPPDLSDADLDDPVDEDEEPSVDALLEDAIRVVLERADPDDFKADGSPKANVVNAELPLHVDRVSATVVAEAFARMQDDISLAE